AAESRHRLPQGKEHRHREPDGGANLRTRSGVPRVHQSPAARGLLQMPVASTMSIAPRLAGPPAPIARANRSRHPMGRATATVMALPLAAALATSGPAAAPASARSRPVESVQRASARLARILDLPGYLGLIGPNGCT